MDSSILKSFAEDKIIATQMMISGFDRVKNIVRKGANAGYQHFLTMFPTAFCFWVIKSRDCMVQT